MPVGPPRVQGDSMTELTSCPSLMLAPTMVTSVTLPGSGLQGSQLETQAGSAEGSLGSCPMQAAARAHSQSGHLQVPQ